MRRTDWPLGPALEKARIKAGLTVRAAARRTDKAVSSGRWYQLESGVQKIKGQDIPIGTTPATVAAAAKAVDWDVDEALTTAGFDPRDYKPQPPPTPLQSATDDELLAEIRRRMKGDGHVMEASPQSPASGQARAPQEVSADERQRARGSLLDTFGDGDGDREEGVDL